MLQELYKVGFILLILSPLFASVGLIVYFMKKIGRKLDKYPLFWLTIYVTMSIVTVYGIMINEIESYSVFPLIAGAEYYRRKFLTKRSRK